VLAYQPGVFAQSPGNEGTKLSIRGSGINRAPGAHGSGVTVMLDGLPLSEPGGTPYELLEPLWACRVEILRGANGFERGGLSLGGVVDYSPAMAAMPRRCNCIWKPAAAATCKFAASTGGWKGALDGYLGWADTRFDGWQRHASGNGKGVVANVAGRSTRCRNEVLTCAIAIPSDLTPGRLTRAQIRHDPRRQRRQPCRRCAPPAAGKHLAANKTTWRIDDASSLVAGLVYHDYPDGSAGKQLSPAHHLCRPQRRARLPPPASAGAGQRDHASAQVLHDLPGNGCAKPCASRATATRRHRSTANTCTAVPTANLPWQRPP
jgi:iron complex outermembrane receptor protein